MQTEVFPNGPSDAEETPPCTRRTFLKQAATWVGGAAILAATGSLLDSCSLLDPSEVRMGTREELLQKGFLTAPLNADETLWVGVSEARQPYALLLTCTHKQCTVRWLPEQREFKCPCHQGRYNARGQVISGRPPAPLMQLQVEQRGPDVWVLNKALERSTV
jgi:nitrite reductase/ring-hydroxylating ferredoxin subunit